MTVWYYLTYKNKVLKQISYDDYRENDFKVFYNKKNDFIRIILPDSRKIEFLWDKEESEVKVMKVEQNEIYNGNAKQNTTEVKKISLPKINSDWEELSNE